MNATLPPEPLLSKKNVERPSVMLTECSSGVHFNYYVTSQHNPSYKYFFAFYLVYDYESLHQEPLVWNAGSVRARVTSETRVCDS